ncbi:MAG: serpin family protein [Acidobacteriota bacterium]|nr:MAG: serpin family protein [Acidobacteriota bacterium]
MERRNVVTKSQWAGIITGAAAIGILMGLPGYVSGEEHHEKGPVSENRTAAPESRTGKPEPVSKEGVAARLNGFAFDLHAELRAEEGNLFFSPFSISSALAMTYAGARGDTAAQMAAVLRLPPADEGVHSKLGALVSELHARGEETDCALHVANALWGQRGLGFRPEYLELIKTSYDGDLRELDFKKDTEGARRTINAWVEEKTFEKIKNLIPRGILKKLTRLVLTNAIYFKGKWARTFDEASTRPAPFHSPTGEREVPMMHQTGRFGYTEDGAVQVLEMPYGTPDSGAASERSPERLSMLVVLPKDESSLGALEDSVNAEKLERWINRLRNEKVKVYLPKFKLTERFLLGKILQEMGMTYAFQTVEPSRADFSGITTEEKLAISEVIHKAFVDVNEEGTEAAAATAVVMARVVGGTFKPSTPVFRADHPFLFFIRDNGTNAILFMGRVVDPKASAEGS